jgi:hypothetical protein
MPTAAATTQDASPASTSLGAKALDLLANPGEVFEEVAAAPPHPENWRVPALLACLSGIILLHATATAEQTAAALRPLLEAGTISTAQAEALAGAWPMVSSLAVCLGVFAGMFWSAFVLWFIGRVFLKSRFSFLKTAEVAGLTGIILALGSIVTVLLIAASGDVTARPALSLFAGKWELGHSMRAALDMMNFFHLWMTAVLAIGLSKLSGVTFKEAAFWVFGYWVAARMALIILA